MEVKNDMKAIMKTKTSNTLRNLVYGALIAGSIASGFGLAEYRVIEGTPRYTNDSKTIGYFIKKNIFGQEKEHIHFDSYEPTDGVYLQSGEGVLTLAKEASCLEKGIYINLLNELNPGKDFNTQTISNGDKIRIPAIDCLDIEDMIKENY